MIQWYRTWRAKKKFLSRYKRIWECPKCNPEPRSSIHVPLGVPLLDLTGTSLLKPKSAATPSPEPRIAANTPPPLDSWNISHEPRGHEAALQNSGTMQPLEKPHPNYGGGKSKPVQITRRGEPHTQGGGNPEPRISQTFRIEEQHIVATSSASPEARNEYRQVQTKGGMSFTLEKQP